MQVYMTDHSDWVWDTGVYPNNTGLIFSYFSGVLKNGFSDTDGQISEVPLSLSYMVKVPDDLYKKDLVSRWLSEV